MNFKTQYVDIKQSKFSNKNEEVFKEAEKLFID